MQEIEQAYHQYAILIVEGFYDILYDDDFLKESLTASREAFSCCIFSSFGS